MNCPRCGGVGPGPYCTGGAVLKRVEGIPDNALDSQFRRVGAIRLQPVHEITKMEAE